MGLSPNSKIGDENGSGSCDTNILYWSSVWLHWTSMYMTYPHSMFSCTHMSTFETANNADTYVCISVGIVTIIAIQSTDLAYPGPLKYSPNDLDCTYTFIRTYVHEYTICKDVQTCNHAHIKHENCVHTACCVSRFLLAIQLRNTVWLFANSNISVFEITLLLYTNY